MQFSKPLFYITLICIAAVSITFFSTTNYPLLNSDDALNILMANDYHFLQDLYCWGQDRGGTIIPLFSQPFIFMGISAINAVTIVNYIILVLGFLTYASLFKNRFTILLFALFWFLPFKEYMDLLRYPIGVQYSLIGCIIYLLHKIHLQEISVATHLKLSALVLISMLVIWASDLSIVSLIVLFVVIFYSLRKEKGRHYPKPIWWYMAGGIALTVAFIDFAKKNANARSEEFLQFNSLAEVYKAIHLILEQLYNTFLYKTNDLMMTILVWLALSVLIVNTLLLKRKLVTFKKSTRILFNYFILELFAIFAVLFTSHWVYLNHMSRRYFVGSYISIVLINLLIFDNSFRQNKLRRMSGILLLVTALLSASSTFFEFKYTWPKSLAPRTESIKELEKLGEIGIIGNFWNSYLLAITNPNQIKVTPHDKANVRKSSLVDEVFEQPRLYLVSDMWMDTFPDFIFQFGYQLQLIGEPFNMANCSMAEYKKVPISQYYYPKKFENLGTLIDDKNFQIDSSSTNGIEDYVFYGPFEKIGIGNFMASFNLTLDSAFSEDAFLRIEVTAEWGVVSLAEKIISPKDFNSGSSQYFELNFETDKRYNNLEFRGYYFGNATFTFKGVALMER